MCNTKKVAGVGLGAKCYTYGRCKCKAIFYLVKRSGMYNIINCTCGRTIEHKDGKWTITEREQNG